jgi:hypothetical protein
VVFFEDIPSETAGLLVCLEGTHSKAESPSYGKDENMDFDPEDARRYFEGVDYPASKEELIDAAESNGAPDVLVERIGTLGRAEFSEPDDVVAELRASPQST